MRMKLAMNPGRLCLPIVFTFALWMMFLVAMVHAQDVNWNANQVPLVSAVRSATNSTPDFLNLGWRGVKVIFDITAVPGADSVTLTIQGKDPASAKYFTLLAGAAETGTATRIYSVYPALPATANVSANDFVPQQWRITITHSAGTNFTYSVSYFYEK